jgi:hypothetical protein
MQHRHIPTELPPFSKLIVSHIFLLDTGGAMIGFCIFI